MIYRKLIKLLKKLPAEKLNQDVTVFIDGEYYPIDKVVTVEDTDVLDKGHIVLSSPSETPNKSPFPGGKT